MTITIGITVLEVNSRVGIRYRDVSPRPDWTTASSRSSRSHDLVAKTMNITSRNPAILFRTLQDIGIEDMNEVVGPPKQALKAQII
jgi:hypothetical protein